MDIFSVYDELRFSHVQQKGTEVPFYPSSLFYPDMYSFDMLLTHYTPVPNELFSYLDKLNKAQIKVWLVVVRQTYGWLDPKTGKRKSRDWISNSFFAKRTGLTRKSVSHAISDLIEKNIIIATDIGGLVLDSPKKRKGRRIYYACVGQKKSNKINSSVDKGHKVSSKRPYTKETQTKEKGHVTENSYRKLTDYQRYLQIMEERKRNKHDIDKSGC